MSQPDYDKISKTYDDARQPDTRLITEFLRHLPARRGLRVLDIGCGTGNYTELLQRMTASQDWQVCGVDPSDAMLAKARAKGPRIDLRSGAADRIPWPGGVFDFIYMTDVIHHVPDIGSMFAEIRRVLSPSGKVCIVTQSHRQIESRPIVRFFPGTAPADKGRYPDIAAVTRSASRHNLLCTGCDALFQDEGLELGPDFLRLVQHKGFSMLWLLGEDEYQQGLHALEEALSRGPIRAKSAGKTLIWFDNREPSAMRAATSCRRVYENDPGRDGPVTLS